jgi:nitroimidazol reductase NimA-like FMN-containing flavoprotein (pyridoxamine 5'-phosphate oxidase superfamily)
MSEFKVRKRNKVKRVPLRAQYDEKIVYEILDAGFVGHVGFSMGSQPFVIPMAYGRKENKIFLHGATTSRLMTQVKQGIPVCLTVTHLDGIVLARSAFHHSMNYRSVVVFGRASEVPQKHKEEALFVISEHILKGRWESSRKPNKKELKATTVLELNIEDASAKIRTGPPKDDKADYQLPIWAGVIPIEQILREPIPDPELIPGLNPGVEVTQLYD